MDKNTVDITITSGPFYRSEDGDSWVNIRKSFDKEYSFLGDLLNDIIDEVHFSPQKLTYQIEPKITDEIGIYIKETDSSRYVYLEIEVKKTLRGKELKNYVVNFMDEYIPYLL